MSVNPNRDLLESLQFTVPKFVLRKLHCEIDSFTWGEIYMYIDDTLYRVRIIFVSKIIFVINCIITLSVDHWAYCLGS